jgi:hypothetical protein
MQENTVALDQLQSAYNRPWGDIVGAAVGVVTILYHPVTSFRTP